MSHEPDLWSANATNMPVNKILPEIHPQPLVIGDRVIFIDRNRQRLIGRIFTIEWCGVYIYRSEGEYFERYQIVKLNFKLYYDKCW